MALARVLRTIVTHPLNRRHKLRAVAFEPIPSTYDRLVDNLRLNHLKHRVTALNQGVGDQRGTLSFTADRDTVNHALAAGEEHANTLEVEVTTLDEALAEESPALMKSARELGPPSNCWNGAILGRRELIPG